VGETQDRVERRAQLVAHAGQEIGFGTVGLFRQQLGDLQLGVALLEHQVQALALRDIPRRGEHPLQSPLPVVESGRVEGDHRLLAIPAARRELVVGDLAFGQDLPDARFGQLRIREEMLERRADQLVPGATGERLHLLVDVGDDALGIGGHDRVDVGFDQ
jgi:hypothetical protein